VRTLFIFAVLLVTGAVRAADFTADVSAGNDIAISVSLDPAEQTGSASATVRIHASRETVWSLITSCPESLRMVPGL